MADASATNGKGPQLRTGRVRRAATKSAAADVDFVTPWSDQPGVVVDITGNEPTIEVAPEDTSRSAAISAWLRHMEETTAEIAALKAEIRRLRTAMRGAT